MRRYGIDSTVLVANLHRGADRDRRVGRGRPAQCRRAPRHHRELPVHAAHHPRRPRDRPRRVRRRARAPRGRPRDAARGPRARRSTTSTSPSWRSGSAAGRTPTRPCETGLRASARSRDAAQLRVWFCAKGLRAQAELAALARARRDADAAPRLARPAREAPRRSLAARLPRPRRSRPNAGGWLALAEAEYERARGARAARRVVAAAATWDRLERPPLAAYCRWREAEALVAAGASRTEASVPLRDAHAVATRIGAQAAAARARAARPTRAARSRRPDATSRRRGARASRALGLTPREAEVLDARRPRLHQPRDRRRARHQRQDRKRPRLAHPAQARRAEPARSRRDRAPPRPAGRQRRELGD